MEIKEHIYDYKIRIITPEPLAGWIINNMKKKKKGKKDNLHFLMWTTFFSVVPLNSASFT